MQGDSQVHFRPVRVGQTLMCLAQALNEVSEQQHVKLRTMSLVAASRGSCGVAGPSNMFINFFYKCTVAGLVSLNV